MLTPKWLEDFHHSLLCHGLPVAYAQRIVTELRDHAEDAGDAEVLGDPATLLRDAVKSYREGYFAGRHPLVAFGLLPIFLVGFFGAMSTVVGEVLLDLAAWLSGQHDSPMMVFFGIVLVRLLGFVAPLGVLWWGALSFRKSGRERGWLLGMAIIITLMAGCIFGHGDGPTPTEVPRLYFELIPFQTAWQFAQSAMLFLCTVGLFLRHPLHLSQGSDS